MRRLVLLLALAGCDRLFLISQVAPLPGVDSRGVDVFTGDAPACAGMFGQLTVVQAGAGPSALAIGDVTGDGRPDVIAANSSGNSLTLAVGAAPRTFVPMMELPAAAGVADVAIVDGNEDGKMDITDIGSSPGILEIRYGNGAGGFLPAGGGQAGNQPRAMRVAYLNADAYPDVAIADFQGTDETVFFGAAGGQASSIFAIPTGKVGGQAVDAADLDGDGDLDLVFANHEEDKVYIARNIGNSTFQAVSTHDTNMGPNSVALVDLTGDGSPEIVTADTTSGLVTVVANDGAGQFVSLSSAIEIAVSTMPWAVAHADFDGDRKQDLVVSNAADNTITVLFGDNNLAFSRVQTFKVGLTPHAVATADADGDGLPDIEVANFGGNSVSVLFNCPN